MILTATYLGVGSLTSAAVVVGVLATAVAGSQAAAAAHRALVRSRLSGSPSGGGVPSWFGVVVTWTNLPLHPEFSWPVARALGVGGVLVLIVTAPVLGLIAVIGGGAAALAGPAMAERRAEDRFGERFPASVDEVVASLRAGSSLVQALEAAAQRPGLLGNDLVQLLEHYEAGASTQEALDGWADRRPGTGVVLVADALALAGATGASQVQALTGVCLTLREHQALAREVRALGAQARLSALAMVVIPVVFAAIVSLADPRIGRFLLDTAGGWTCLSLGAMLNLVGGWWMNRLIVGVGR